MRREIGRRSMDRASHLLSTLVFRGYRPQRMPQMCYGNTRYVMGTKTSPVKSDLLPCVYSRVHNYRPKSTTVHYYNYVNIRLPYIPMLRVLTGYVLAKRV